MEQVVLQLEKKYKVLKIYQENNKYLYPKTFIDIKDILTGEISNGWLIDRFQIEFEYDVNKYNL